MIVHTAFPSESNCTVLIVVGRHTSITLGDLGTLKHLMMNCSEEEYLNGLNKYRKNSCMMQDAFSFLSEDEREFLISGMLPDEFSSMVEKECG